MRNLIMATIAALSVSACADTQEYPLAPNMVRLDISPPAGPFVREATLRRAAELTLRNGYSAFRLDPIYVEAFDDFGVPSSCFMLAIPEPRTHSTQRKFSGDTRRRDKPRPPLQRPFQPRAPCSPIA
jgi:hypothetical protein